MIYFSCLYTKPQATTIYLSVVYSWPPDGVSSWNDATNRFHQNPFRFHLDISQQLLLLRIFLEPVFNQHQYVLNYCVFNKTLTCQCCQHLYPKKSYKDNSLCFDSDYHSYHHFMSWNVSYTNHIIDYFTVLIMPQSSYWTLYLHVCYVLLQIYM